MQPQGSASGGYAATEQNSPRPSHIPGPPGASARHGMGRNIWGVFQQSERLLFERKGTKAEIEPTKPPEIATAKKLHKQRPLLPSHPVTFLRCREEPRVASSRCPHSSARHPDLLLFLLCVFVTQKRILLVMKLSPGHDPSKQHPHENSTRYPR